MNPYINEYMEPNFWLSCILIDEKAMCDCERTDNSSHYVSESGKTCPDEIFDILATFV